MTRNTLSAVLLLLLALFAGQVERVAAFGTATTSPAHNVASSADSRETALYACGASGEAAFLAEVGDPEDGLAPAAVFEASACLRENPLAIGAACAGLPPPLGYWPTAPPRET